MKIGIVSDSHGGVSILRAAIRILILRGVEAVVHCGDLGSVKCITILAESPVSTYAVAGNVDRNIDALVTAAKKSGVAFHDQVVEVPLGDEDKNHLVITHGHDGLLDELIMGGQFPYVCHGHTHRIRDERIDSVHVICPGALRNPKQPRYPTVAMLDTSQDTVEFIRVG